MLEVWRRIGAVGPARADLESTAGPVEHARVVCVDRHWFLLPTAGLTSVNAAALPRGVDAGRVGG